jgi:hypothetical protein
VRDLVAFRPRRASEFLFAVVAVAFLGWLLMKFYMDNSNDGETQAYVRDLLARLSSGALPEDATGHYTAIAALLVWPFTTLLEPYTTIFEIRGFVLARLLVGLALFAAAYVWYRRIGLSPLSSLVGLVLLSTSTAFALLIRGWELDKLIEPALFLTVATLAWKGRWLAVLPLAVLAAANRETGIFMPLVVLAALVYRQGGYRAALRHWALWATLLVCAVGVSWLHRADVSAATPWLDVNADRVVYVIGGMCLTPLFAVAWWRSAPPGVGRLFLLLVPVWVLYVLVTDRLEQGAVLLTPLALLFVPMTLAGLEQVLLAQPASTSAIVEADARVPVGPPG